MTAPLHPAPVADLALPGTAFLVARLALFLAIVLALVVLPAAALIAVAT